MKIPHFGMNPDNCKAGYFEVGCQRWNIPTNAYNTVQTVAGKKFGERIETPDTIFPSDRMLQKILKELKHQTRFSLQTGCCKIWWKHGNTRHSFPSDRMLQNLLKELKHLIQFSLQTECCTGKFSPSMLELWASAGQLRGRLLNTTQYWTLLCHHCNHSTLRQAVVCGALLWLQAHWLAFSDLNKK